MWPWRKKIEIEPEQMLWEPDASWMLWVYSSPFSAGVIPDDEVEFRRPEWATSTVMPYDLFLSGAHAQMNIDGLYWRRWTGPTIENGAKVLELTAS